MARCVLGRIPRTALTQPRLWRTAAVVVCATCAEASSLPACLRAPGRLDATVALPPPGTAGRAGMLAAELSARGLTFASEDLQVCGLHKTKHQPYKLFYGPMLATMLGAGRTQPQSRQSRERVDPEQVMPPSPGNRSLTLTALHCYGPLQN